MQTVVEQIGDQVVVGDYVLELVAEGHYQFTEFYSEIKGSVDPSGHQCFELNTDGVCLFSGDWEQVTNYLERLDPEHLDSGC